MHAVAVVPAAGSAERFGGRKLLADVRGATLIERTVASLRDGGVTDIVVVVGPDTGRLLDAPDVRTVLNPDPSRGMFSSLQAGMADLRADAIVILPGDMPFVDPATIRSLLRTFEVRGGIVSPRFEGKRGHPVVLPPTVGEEIVAAEPTGTLHHVLAAHREERIDLDVDDRGVLRDVDRPEDLVDGAHSGRAQGQGAAPAAARGPTDGSANA